MKEWVIDDKYKAELDIMVRSENITKVKFACAKSKLDKAIADGDTDKALLIYPDVSSLQDDALIAQKSFWERIRQIQPEVPEGETYKFDTITMKVRRYYG